MTNLTDAGMCTTHILTAKFANGCSQSSKWKRARAENVPGETLRVTVHGASEKGDSGG